MENRNIVVIGASTGGFDAIKKLVADLPPDLNAAVFIVWHLPADALAVLPQVLNRYETLPAKHATDRETFENGRIYIAPPDRHLVLDKGVIRVTHGPKENRFRPAIDPLFRSAAYAYGSRVIGIILSGGLDDGSSGLWAIKRRGGIAIVQSPEDAEVPSMPINALRMAEVDYKIPVKDMAHLLTQLCTSGKLIGTKEENMEENEKINLEVRIAIHDEPTGEEIFKYGELTPYTCPECHGVLVKLKDGNTLRFRCHTGHAFSSEALLAAITDSIEDSLWYTIRSIEENTMLLNHMGRHFEEANEPLLATAYFQKAKEAESRANSLRITVQYHERLANEIVRSQKDEC